MIRRRIAIIGPARTPIAEPFSGGLTAHIRALTERLCRRGHDVTLFAAPGSDPSLPVVELAMNLQLSETARQDVSMPPEVFLHEHHAYLALMIEPGPPARCASTSSTTTACTTCRSRCPTLLPAPMVTTLHTPPTPWLESAVQVRPRRRCASSPSAGTPPRSGAAHPRAGRRRRTTASTAMRGRRARVARAGLVGRMVPEKAPHLAILAARLAGTRLAARRAVLGPGVLRERGVAAARPRRGLRRTPRPRGARRTWSARPRWRS